MSEFADSFHQLTASIIPQLTAFLQLRYRVNDQRQTPFAVHPFTMYVAVSSFVIQYLLHVALLRSPTSCRFAAVAEHFLVWSGYTAVSTLAAAVFPDRASPFVYAIFGLLSAGEMLHIFGDKLVIDDEEDEHEEEEEASKFGIYKKCVGRFLKIIYCRIVVKFFKKQPQPILPI